MLGQHEARLVNIEVESVSPLLFTAVMVANQGAYGKEWYWYFGVSDAQLNELSSGRRIIDLETYESGGQRLFAAVLVANTGSEEKEWGWHYDVAAGGVDNLSEAQGFRIIDLETYLASGQLRFAFVMVKNVGADQRGWNWDYGSSVAEIQSLADSGRFIDLENDPQGGYSTVRVDCPCPRWWYYTGVTEGDVDALAAQNGARPIAIEPYTAPALGKRFNVIMLDNTAPGTATPTVLPSPTPTTISTDCAQRAASTTSTIVPRRVAVCVTRTATATLRWVNCSYWDAAPPPSAPSNRCPLWSDPRVRFRGSIFLVFGCPLAGGRWMKGSSSSRPGAIDLAAGFGFDSIWRVAIILMRGDESERETSVR